MEEFVDAISFEKELQQLKDKLCWGIVAGPPSGSVVNLSFGARHKRDRPIDNINLTAAERDYDSDYGLMIYCSWRIDSDSRIIADNNQPNHKGGAMLQGLEMLRGATVTAVKFSKPAYDLEICFDSGLTLKIFYCSIDTTDDDENYSYFTPAGVFTVLAEGKLEFEEESE